MSKYFCMYFLVSLDLEPVYNEVRRLRSMYDTRKG